MRMFRRRKGEDDDIIEGEIEDIIDEDEEPEAEAEAATFAPPQDKPKRGGFFRRQSKTAESAAPTTPLERVHPDLPTPDEDVISEYVLRGSETQGRRLPRIRLPRLIAWNEIRPAMLLLAIGLIAGGVFWTLYNLDATSAASEEWWPAILLGLGVIWAIVSLATRRAAAFLAATALVGISISLLLSAQDLIEWHETMVGTVLITIGVGIVARGFLLRQGTVAR